MQIQKIEIYKYSIPMHPFTIATGTMHFAQNILLKVFVNNGLVGWGECSAFPMIVGETQATCFAMAQDFAQLWLGKNPLDIAQRMDELHAFTAGNYTIKSALDMALFDIAAKNAQLPLYAFLGGTNKEMLSDITVGIGTPAEMAQQAVNFVKNGATILKIKLGKDVTTDVARIQAIRTTVGNAITIRVDANQGWSYEAACTALTELATYNIEFCEQPMRTYNNHLLPSLMQISPIKIMADESVYTHYDALEQIRTNSCHYINIKLAKSGGILEAQKIIEVATKNNIHCMMGGMLESRLALTAFAHFASANPQIHFYDMDTCMLGHKTDPVIGGVTYNNYRVQLPANIVGIGVTVEQAFLDMREKIVVA
jgi:L-Ala-D/L-Glu epimerase